MPWWAKERQDRQSSTATYSMRKPWNRFSLPAWLVLRKGQPCWPPWFWIFWLPELRRINLCCFKPCSLVVCYSSSNKPIQTCNKRIIQSKTHQYCHIWETFYPVQTSVSPHPEKPCLKRMLPSLLLTSNKHSDSFLFFQGSWTFYGRLGALRLYPEWGRGCLRE